MKSASICTMKRSLFEKNVLILFTRRGDTNDHVRVARESGTSRVPTPMQDEQHALTQGLVRHQTAAFSSPGSVLLLCCRVQVLGVDRVLLVLVSLVPSGFKVL